MNEQRLIVSAPPHVRATQGTGAIMWWVFASLVPAALAAVWFMKIPALVVILCATGSAVAAEWAYQRATGAPVTISDGSAALTGLLLAFTLPPMLPWWIAVIGGVVAIVLGKQLFGGLGWNVFNPALVGRAFLTLSWIRQMTGGWFKPAVAVDATTSATPLYAMKLVRAGELTYDPATTYTSYLWGNLSGSVGEVSAVLLLLGAALLLAKRIIDWRIPATFIGSVVLIALAAGEDPLFHLLAGGLILGAFFMATDYVSSSITPTGKLIFGAGCGVVTMLLRIASGLPEAVMFAILFMNCLAPLIDRYTIPRKFGWVKPS